MPKKYTTPNSKRQVSATSKLIRESEKQAKRDLTERWRFLRKIGAYQTKESAAQCRLTKSRIREIEKRFKEIQSSMKSLHRGRTVYPVKLVTAKTKSGHAKTYYDWSPKFTFVKTTKKKPKVDFLVKKTKKGYIVPKTNPKAKVTISKSGEIIETVGRTRRRVTRYSEKDLLKLLDKFDKGKFKFKKGQAIAFHRFGSPTEFVKGTEQAMQFISNYVANALRTFDEKSKQRFLELSYIEFVEDTNDDDDSISPEDFE